ncbi:MAG: ABC transporter substrate-binding protein [Alphaproteobacteria bacterium]|nr:ABC transporter substrate-binding protein [Alphaproteobacteria bacterium]
MMVLRGILITAFCLLAILPGLQSHAQEAPARHALVQFGEPKYGPGFTHFDYVNPAAPKGGQLRQLATGTFDTLNPFILKGTPASGIGLIFESLLTGSADEIDTSAEYGLIAKSIEVPEDYSWVIFNLRPEARWHDGKPITADDVVFSFDTLTKKGHPFYRQYYGSVAMAEKINDHRVKFTFRGPTNRELPNIVGQLSILPKHYYESIDFTETSLEPPVASGPYRIKRFEPGRFIEYERVADYWGATLPVNVGRYNFDNVRFDYYRDATVAREAFKSYEFDTYLEFSAKDWATGYDFPAFRNGLVKKEEIPDLTSPGMQSFVFNTRREIFSDRRVRQALGLAFDFEWSNKALFYDQYKRTTSYFENMELASSDLPSGTELEYLTPFKAQVPEEVFTTPFNVPKTDASGNPRRQLRDAARLLKSAGWEIRGGTLTHPETGKTLSFEILLIQPSLERVVLPFISNLEKLGVKATVRTVDTSQYQSRQDSFDYDMIVTTFRQSFSPGNEQRDFWGSASADLSGGRNLAGIKDPVVDALIEKIITAPNRDSLIAATRALDRVLLWGFYVIPQFYVPVDRLAFWDKFGRPETRPKFGFDTFSWWIDPQKLSRVESGRRP